VTLQVVEYAWDGVQLTGYLALPAGGRDLLAVLVAHESSGMNDNIRSRALALAKRGYALGHPGLSISERSTSHCHDDR
jgi:dienelactone hydrolase